MDCIFCKIISGEIPCYKIFEDEHTLAFLDISQDVFGHTIVIPKKHVKNLLDCDNETLNYVMNTVKIVSHHFISNCEFNGINLLNANEISAQQSVFHLHFHVIPRKENDGIDAWPNLGTSNYTLEEMHKSLRMD